MPGHARKDLVREGEVATYHCWSRCVQRSFLCGFDPLTGRDFSYRRGWAEDLLAYQAGVFAVDVGNYNLLSNHAHNILRTRPDIADTWSHEELALRWKLAWPEFRDGQWVREPKDQEIEDLLALPEKLEWIRRNLSSLSWFMARWKEPIAKICNKEMETLLRCRAAGSADFGQCPAGILRMDNKQASVVVKSPQGEQFTINFMTGYVNATNREVKAELKGDTWTVTVEHGEIYEVPLCCH